MQKLFFLASHWLNGLYFASLQRDRFQLLSAETLAAQLKYGSLIKDAVKRAQKRRILIEIFAPESRVLVAGEDHIEMTFLVVTPVNQIKEQLRIFLVEFAMANLINNQAGRAD